MSVSMIYDMLQTILFRASIAGATYFKPLSWMATKTILLQEQIGL